MRNDWVQQAALPRAEPSRGEGAGAGWGGSGKACCLASAHVLGLIAPCMQIHGQETHELAFCWQRRRKEEEAGR